MEIDAAKKIYATNLVKNSTEAMSLGKEWPEMSLYNEELALLRGDRDMRLPGMTVRRAIKADRAEDWSELMKSVEITPSMTEGELFPGESGRRPAQEYSADGRAQPRGHDL